MGFWRYSSWYSSERGLVFASEIGTPLKPMVVLRHFQGLLRAAGLQRYRLHDLRHACATLMLLQSVDLRVVQEVLGHSTYHTTANVYAHVLPQLKHDAANRMDAILHRQEAS